MKTMTTIAAIVAVMSMTGVTQAQNTWWITDKTNNNVTLSGNYDVIGIDWSRTQGNAGPTRVSAISVGDFYYQQAAERTLTNLGAITVTNLWVTKDTIGIDPFYSPNSSGTVQNVNLQVGTKTIDSVVVNNEHPTFGNAGETIGSIVLNSNGIRINNGPTSNAYRNAFGKTGPNKTPINYAVYVMGDGVVTNATVNGGTFVNEGTITNMTYKGGEFRGEGGSISTLILAGQAGVTGWGDVGNLAFAEGNALTIYGFDWFNVGSVDLTGANITWDMSGESDANIQDWWESIKGEGAFGLATLFGVSEVFGNNFEFQTTGAGFGWLAENGFVYNADAGGFTWDVSESTGNPVPAPATLVVLGLGLAGLGLARWRMRM